MGAYSIKYFANVQVILSRWFSLCDAVKNRIVKFHSDGHIFIFFLISWAWNDFKPSTVAARPDGDLTIRAIAY